MTIALGGAPESMTLRLSAGSPLLSTLRLSGGTWDDYVVELRVGATVWPAVTAGPDAVWSVSASAVDAVIDERRASLWLNGALWATGNVVVSRG